MREPETEFRRLPESIRVEAAADKHLVGYAIVTNSLSEDLGGFRERIRPEALERTLREGLDVRALVDHESGKVIGRVTAGTLQLRKDTRGLYVDIDPPKTQVGKDILESVRRGDITGMSFAFRTLEDEWQEDADGVVVRDVVDMRVREISIVSFPAYPATSVEARSLEVARQAFQARHLVWSPSIRFRERELHAKR